MATQDKARNLLARRRQQSVNRRAAMLGRSEQEVSRSSKLQDGLQ